MEEKLKLAVPMDLQLHADSVMRAEDTYAGYMAKAYATIKGNRYHLFNIKDFDFTGDVTLIEIARTGTNVVGVRPGLVKLPFSGTIHFNTPIFIDLLLEYLETKVFPPIDLQITNEDPVSSLGRNTVIAEGCYLDKVQLTKIAAGGDPLDAPISGIANNIKNPEKMNMLEGMI